MYAFSNSYNSRNDAATKFLLHGRNATRERVLLLLFKKINAYNCNMGSFECQFWSIGFCFHLRWLSTIKLYPVWWSWPLFSEGIPSSFPLVPNSFLLTRVNYIFAMYRDNDTEKLLINAKCFEVSLI